MHIQAAKILKLITYLILFQSYDEKSYFYLLIFHSCLCLLYDIINVSLYFSFIINIRYSILNDTIADKGSSFFIYQTCTFFMKSVLLFNQKIK